MSSDITTAKELFRITATPDGVKLRIYYYNEDESELNATPTYRTGELEPHWIKTKDVELGAMKHRAIVCDKEGIPDAIKLLYAHFSKQLELKTQELQDLANKVEHLKRYQHPQ